MADLDHVHSCLLQQGSNLYVPDLLQQVPQSHVAIFVQRTPAVLPRNTGHQESACAGKVMQTDGLDDQ
eukprot:scaffold164615_cov13-Tisochrysis_lutea.AAC.1